MKLSELGIRSRTGRKRGIRFLNQRACWESWTAIPIGPSLWHSLVEARRYTMERRVCRNGDGRCTTSFRTGTCSASPQALDGDLSLSGQKLFADDIPDSNRAQREPALHLAVNLRSFRAVRVAEWVEALLRGDSVAATKVTAQIQEFPIAFTRSLERARGWLRIHARGLRRCGLVASSSAVRLRAFGSKSQQDFAKGTGTCTSTGIWRRQRT